MTTSRPGLRALGATAACLATFACSPAGASGPAPDGGPTAGVTRS